MTIELIKSLRKKLHKHPELSGQEAETAGRIKRFIKKYDDAKIIENIGGHGLAVIYEFSSTGPTIVIRCELDALPIEEINNFEYRSRIKKVSHKCGHDGHMAILTGLTFWLKKQNFNNGKVILLFQPAEEKGTGAFAVINDSKFSDINPDYIFALHNIPGEPLHSIVMLDGNFSSTVQSVAIQLEGEESHSAQPEQGINPALCIAELTQIFHKLNVNDPADKDFRLCVPIYFNMGKQSYGISAGFGEMHYTMRTRNVAQMEKLKQEVEDILSSVCPTHKLGFTTKWFDYFPTVINDKFCNQVILETAKAHHFDIIHKKAPFKFGEDFGWFSERYKGAMFGIGAGIECSGLHKADYDFPEEILETGMDMFNGIINFILKSQQNEKRQD